MSERTPRENAKGENAKGRAVSERTPRGERQEAKGQEEERTPRGLRAVSERTPRGPRAKRRRERQGACARCLRERQEGERQEGTPRGRTPRGNAKGGARNACCTVGEKTLCVWAQGSCKRWICGNTESIACRLSKCGGGSWGNASEPCDPDE